MGEKLIAIFIQPSSACLAPGFIISSSHQNISNTFNPHNLYSAADKFCMHPIIRDLR